MPNTFQNNWAPKLMPPTNMILPNNFNNFNLNNMGGGGQYPPQQQQQMGGTYPPQQNMQGGYNGEQSGMQMNQMGGY
jgi:hypothetical protein